MALLENRVYSPNRSGATLEMANRSSADLSERRNPGQRQRHWRALSANDVQGRFSRPRDTWNEPAAQEPRATAVMGSIPAHGRQYSARDVPAGEKTGLMSQDTTLSIRSANSSSTSRGEDLSSFSPSQSTIHRSLGSDAGDEPNNLLRSPGSGASSASVAIQEAEESEGTLLERKSRSSGISIPGRLRKPDPLSFLETDSPPVTEESILQAIAQASENWSPRSISSFDSISSSQRSATETDTTTPEHSVGGDTPPTTALPRPSQLGPDGSAVANSGQTKQQSSTRRPRLHPHLDEAQDRYGTPEMARGSVKHPHFPPNELQPRLAAPGQRYPKHLPRAEKLPMTGYELLAAKLSTPESWGTRRGSNESSPSDEDPTIKPIYRRFEALNHRLLLHLQDELSELEEQLHRLDTADTQTRRLQNCILPASRRAEFMAGGELQWRKTDILGKIGFKLGQYNHALGSLTKTLSLPAASMSDIEEYRTYLATHNPIAEIETRFLDPAEDLVCLATTDKTRSSDYSPSLSFPSGSSDELLTPVPHKMIFDDTKRPCSRAGRTPCHSRSASASSSLPPAVSSDRNPKCRERPALSPRDLGDAIQKSKARYEDDTTTTRTTSPEPAEHADQDIPLEQAVILASLAILIPILTFPLVVDFLGRMAVVLVAGLVVSALRRSLSETSFCEPTAAGRHDGRAGGGKGLMIIAVYGAVMAVIAALF